MMDRAEVWGEIVKAVEERFADRYEVHHNDDVGTITVIDRKPSDEPRSGVNVVEIHHSTFRNCGSGPFGGKNPYPETSHLTGKKP